MIKKQEFKEYYHDVFIKSSSVPIQNDLPTITSDHPSSEHECEIKIHAKTSPYNQSFEKQEEELM